MAPFKLSKDKNFYIQSDLLIALIPIIMWGVYVFGGRVVTITATSVIVSILTEIAFYAVSKNIRSFSPLRSITAGILSGLILPVSAPIWAAALGGFIVSIITLISGGIRLSGTIINPVAASGLILYGLFGKIVNRFTAPFDKFSVTQFSTGDASQITPILQTLKDGTDNITNSTLINISLGRDSGAIGEVSALLIVVAFAYLVFKKYISWHIPVTFISSVFLISFFFPVGNCETIYCATTEVLTGSVVFLAVFIASSPSSAPLTSGGKIFFGIGCGIITMILRRYTYLPDGSLYAVGIMSCLTNIIDCFTGNKYFSYLTDRKKESEPKKTDLEALLKD